MKKVLLILFISLILMSCNKSLSLIRINKDNTEVPVEYPSNITELTILDSDEYNYKTVNLKGLENFNKLEEISFYTLAFLKDFSFLKDVNLTCKRLYFERCSFFGFENIEHLQNLEEIEFDGYITDQQFDNLIKNGIDLTYFPKLKSVTLQFDESKKTDFLKIKIIHNKKIKREGFKILFLDN